ncbi:MAG: ORF6N domain-containing protein [Treponema sp.]|nr:ORF6N domain-containing protein [Treponema sp.]
MENEISILEDNSIRSKIHIIRGQQVMIDRDIAELYGVETKRLNEQVKRNIERFPEQFCFQLTREEVENLKKQNLVKSQFVTSPKEDSVMSQLATSNLDNNSSNLMSQFATSSWGGIRKPPYVFTEHGVTMLASVLKSETAVKTSIQIVKAFVSMRHFVANNAELFAELKAMRQYQIETDVHLKESDKKIDELFSLMDKYNIKETQGIFFQGQIFDAYAKFESFLAAAKKEIILIDNYVDLSILQRLAKKKKGVTVTIYTDPKTKLTAQDIQTFNAQYPTLTMSHTTKTHDRFLIIDNSTIYHIGASLKDLGKKCFGFSILDPSFIPMILGNL